MIAQAEPVLVDAALRYGPLGLILIAAALGWIYFKPSVQDLRDALALARQDNKEVREDLRRNEELLKSIVPAVTQTSAAVQELTRELLWRRDRGSAA